MKGLKCVVCGMLINAKNFNINQYSFLETNTEDNIISCPFCGAGKLYLSIEDEISRIDKIALNADSIKVLDNAMKLEVFNGEFYQEASRLAQSEEIKRMFKDLSSIEFMHARVHMRLGSFDGLPKLHKPDYSKHDTDELLLKEAAKREKHAVHFYERNGSKITCEAIKKVLGALSEVEKQHMEMTGNR